MANFFERMCQKAWIKISQYALYSHIFSQLHSILNEEQLEKHFDL